MRDIIAIVLAILFVFGFIRLLVFLSDSADVRVLAISQVCKEHPEYKNQSDCDGIDKQANRILFNKIVSEKEKQLNSKEK